MVRELTDELYFGDMASSSTIMHLRVLVFFSAISKTSHFCKTTTFSIYS